MNSIYMSTSSFFCLVISDSLTDIILIFQIPFYLIFHPLQIEFDLQSTVQKLVNKYTMRRHEIIKLVEDHSLLINKLHHQCSVEEDASAMIEERLLKTRDEIDREIQQAFEENGVVSSTVVPNGLVIY